jgi:hypothetical protein
VPLPIFFLFSLVILGFVGVINLLILVKSDFLFLIFSGQSFDRDLKRGFLYIRNCAVWVKFEGVARRKG